MTFPLLKAGTGVMAAMLLGACGGGGGDDTAVDPTVEVTDPAYTALTDRTSTETRTLTFIFLENGDLDDENGSVFSYADGTISGGALGGFDIDDAEFTNPANGEFTRILTTSSSGNLFGVVGIGTESADRPDGGTVNYNEGWIGVTATADSKVYVLEGDASLTADFDTGEVSATFAGFSGTDELDQTVNNAGTLTVTGAPIVGLGGFFEDGTVAGTGIFADIDPDLNNTEFFGAFYGPDADEVGGVIDVDTGPVTVSGAFQAD